MISDSSESMTISLESPSFKLRRRLKLTDAECTCTCTWNVSGPKHRTFRRLGENGREHYLRYHQKYKYPGAYGLPSSLANNCNSKAGTSYRTCTSRIRNFNLDLLSSARTVRGTGGGSQPFVFLYRGENSVHTHCIQF